MEAFHKSKEKKIFEGEVVHGQKEGRTLGFPTANVRFKGEMEQGIYSGMVIIDGKMYKAGIMYREGTDILETYILDFSGDLYGQKIKVKIHERIRNIMNFKNNDELIAQIKKDIEFIKSI